ncbi:MAG TPA: 30S ribosomal protein S13 [Candidatus Aquilonibacter sp.]|nr:30S ribosomal protein S13 [Candidatus Aquilonibacter sp.]
MADEKKGNPQMKKEETSIIRIAGKDIAGSYNIPKALNQVKGIGINMAHAIALVAERKHQIKQTTQIGTLDDATIEKLEAIIKEPQKNGIPSFLLNKQREPETNQDMHLVGSDLIVKVKQEIESEIKKQSWRGYRHQYKQKVRGQRTRSTGRTGDTIGVMKSKAVPAPAAKPADAKKK